MSCLVEDPLFIDGGDIDDDLETETKSTVHSEHEEQVLEFIHCLQYEEIPDIVKTEAKRALLDVLGCGIGARKTKLAKKVIQFCKTMYGGKGGRLWCDEAELSVVGAALANALTVDALDIHDSGHNAKGHAGVAIVPAALLLAKPLKEIDGLQHLRNKRDLDFDTPLNGEEFITTLVIGYEIAYRAGETLISSVTHEYHSSGAWNALGCAAMWSRRLKLSFVETLHALGIAEYYAPRSPVMRVMDNPSMLKDGSGVGCWAGVTGAILASTGFTGAPAALFSPPQYAHIWSTLKSEWHLSTYHVYKKHPTCYWAQGAINGALKVRSKILAAGESLKDIKELRVLTFPEAYHLYQKFPKTTEQAQYSIGFSAASAYLKGFVDVSEETGLRDISLKKLVQKTRIDIHISFLDQKEHDTRVHDNCADVRVELSNGKKFSSGLSYVEWDKYRNMPEPTTEELEEKFYFLCQSVSADEKAAREISDICRNMEIQQDASVLETAISKLVLTN